MVVGIFDSMPKKLFPNRRSQFACMFSSKRYTGLDLMFKSAILIAYMMWGRGQFLSVFAYGNLEEFVEQTSFSHELYWHNVIF